MAGTKESLQSLKSNYLKLVAQPDFSFQNILKAITQIISDTEAIPADQRNDEQDLLLGYCMLTCPPGREDAIDIGLACLERAHKAGNIEAKAVMIMAHNGYFSHIPIARRSLTKTVILNQDIQKTNNIFAVFESARRAGHLDEENKTQISIALAQECIRLNYIGGYYLMGFWMSKTNDSPHDKDNEKALRFFEDGLKSPIDDFPSAIFKSLILYELGKLYGAGYAVSKDKEKSLALMDQASKLGSRYARGFFEDYDNFIAHYPTLSNNNLAFDPSAMLGGKLNLCFENKNDSGTENISLLANKFLSHLNRDSDGSYINLAIPDVENRGELMPRVRIHFPSLEAVAGRETFDNADAPEKQIEKILSPFGNLPGLATIQKEVEDILGHALINKHRRQHNLSVRAMSKHMVFAGNPGTGKTHIARMLGSAFYECGLLPDGHVIEADTASLTGAYIGWSEMKTKTVCEAALGGVLFIDEAYALTDDQNLTFGSEVINVLLKFMEDHGQDFILIVAGYKDKMEGFLRSNPGLRSRFSKTIDFPDYSPEEMLEIFKVICSEHEYTADAGACRKVLNHLKSMKDKDRMRFANARGVRNLFDESIKNQSQRLLAEKKFDKESLVTIVAADIPGDARSGPDVINREGNISYLGDK